jgi:hypothetical protein
MQRRYCCSKDNCSQCTERILYQLTLTHKRFCTKDTCTERILYQRHLHREDPTPRTPTRRGYCTKDSCADRKLDLGHLHKEETAPKTTEHTEYCTKDSFTLTEMIMCPENLHRKDTAQGTYTAPRTPGQRG